MSQTEKNGKVNEETKYKLSLVLLIALACVAIFAVVNMVGTLSDREVPDVTTEPVTTEAPVTTEPPVVRMSKTVSNKIGGTLIVVNNANLYQPLDALTELKNTDVFQRAENGMYIREEALENMKNAFALYKEEYGEDENFCFPHISLAFRSVEKQKEKYDASTDKTTVSVPGGSDLHTGYSFHLMLVGSDDKYYQLNSFPNVQNWMNENLPKFGFIDRYPENGNTDFKGTGIVGYGFYRYVGLPHSIYISHNGISLEDYIEKLKTDYCVDENPEFELEDLLEIEYDEQKYYMLYVSEDNNKATIDLPPDTEIHSFSGDNIGGFVIVLTKTAMISDTPLTDAVTDDEISSPIEATE